MRTHNIILIFLLLLSGSLIAQTNVPAGIVGETVAEEWTKENSPYLIQGDLEIVDLNIQAGVEVLFTDNFKFDVSGVLTANGFYSDSIYFKPDSNNINGWGGVSFLPASTNSELSYCRIEGANKQGIKVDQSSPQISNSNLIWNNGEGILLKSTQIGLTNCVIKENTKNGIKLNSAELTLTNVIVAGNGQAGIYSPKADDALDFTNVVIADNEGTGVISDAGNIFITNSIIYYNAPDVDLWDDFKTVSYSNIGGGAVFSGVGNINKIPGFKDHIQFELAPGSSCIDAGKNVADQFFPPSLGTFKNDMGAYGGPGAGKWYPPVFIDPDTLDFQMVSKDSGLTLPLPIHNYRDVAITVSSIEILGPDSAVFSIDQNSLNLNVGASAELLVTFLPRSNMQYEADLILHTDSLGSISAKLRGQGVVAELAVSDSLLDFGSTSIGDSVNLEIYLSNTGEDFLHIQQIFTSNSAFVSWDSSLTIDPGSIDTLTVIFKPDSARNYQDSLFILSNDHQNSLFAIELSGSGSGAVIDLSRDSLAFESVWLGSDSTLSLWIANPGNLDLEIESLDIVALDSTPGAFRFRDENLALPLLIKPAGQFELLITFDPDSTGIDSALLNIVSNDPIRSLKEVMLSGTGIASIISITQTELDFGQVAFLSDSVQTIFISNAGNKILNIEDIQIEHQELQSETFRFIDPTWILPLDLQPDSSIELTIQYKPVESNSDSASLLIKCNDPLQPQAVVYLSGYSIAPQIFLAQSEINFEQLAKNAESVKYLKIYNHGEGDLLVYKDSLSISGSDSEDFSVDIPASDLRILPNDSAEVVVRSMSSLIGAKTAQLELISNDPLNQSLALPLSVLIIESELAQIELDLSHSSTQFIKGQSANLSFSIASHSTVDSAAVFLRLGGKSAFTKLPLTRQESTDFWSAQIESDWITERGLEYYVHAYYGWTSSFWPENGDQNPKAMQVVIPSLVFPQQTKKEIYQKISIPALTSGQTLSALFEDDLGTYDPEKYRLFDCVDGQNFNELTNLDSNLPPGKALWLVTKEPVTLDLDNGLSPSTEQPYSITLKQGWNMIGTPFAFPVTWSEIDDVHPLRYYDGSDWPFVSVLEPFKGYAVYVDQDTIIQVAANEASGTISQFKKKTALAEGEWQIQISVEADSLKDQFNYAGVHPQAVAGTDRYDYPEPPPIGSYVQLSFVNHNSKQYSTNIQESDKDGYIFPFEVSSNVKNEMTIKVVPKNLPENLSWLVLAPETRVKFSDEIIACASNRATYQLVVGNETFLDEVSQSYSELPQKFHLHQNYPNPFNPATQVTFQLPTASKIRVDIYNVLGQRLKTLIKNQYMQPGFYTVHWDGSNDAGKKVATGVYFLHLRSKQFHKTIKMILQN